MSDEINDIIQIGNLLYRISSGILLASIRVIHYIEISKWKGKESLSRLHRTCGSNIGYLQIDSQNQKVINSTLSLTLKRYNVLFAKLPDLNLGDNKTQFAFNAEQISSIQAALNNYATLRGEKIEALKKQFGENSDAFIAAKKTLSEQMPNVHIISANDYAISRLDAAGNETPEYQQLEQNAKETLQFLENEKNIVDNTPTKEKVSKILEIENNIENKKKLNNGTAKRIQIEDIEEIPINDKNKNQSIFKVDIPESENQLILNSNQVLNKKDAIIEPSKLYNIRNITSGKVTQIKGSQILEDFAKNKTIKVGKPRSIKKIYKATKGIHR